MVRRKAKGLVLLTVVSGLLLTSFVTILFVESDSFDWGVNIGDEFIYEISVFTESQLDYYQHPLSPLNNSRIRLTISNLPDIPVIWSSSQFMSEIIDVIKTNCTAFNGAELLLNQSVPLNTILSWCILPVGNWDHLAFLFSNRIAYPDVGYYVAISNTSCFTVGSNLVNGEMDYGWSAAVDLATGTPYRYHSNYFTEYSYPIHDEVTHTITISLVD